MTNQNKIDRIKKGKPFSLFDIIAISLSVALCVALIAYSCAVRKDGDTLIIKQYAEGITTRYSLLENQDITLKMENGEMLIRIRNGSAFVVTSSCRGQNCVHMPTIKYKGQSIMCVDLKVNIIVEGQSNFTPIS